MQALGESSDEFAEKFFVLPEDRKDSLLVFRKFHINVHLNHLPNANKKCRFIPNIKTFTFFIIFIRLNIVFHIRPLL